MIGGYYQMRDRRALVIGALLAWVAVFPVLSIEGTLASLHIVSAELNAPYGTIQFGLGVFCAGYAIGQVVYGILADTVGRKLTLQGGILVFFLGSLGCAYATSWEAMAVYRFVQGLGACIGPMIARVILKDTTEGGDITKKYSHLIITLTIATILIPIAGQRIGAATGWRNLFLGLATYGAIALVSVQFGVRETLASTSRSRISLGLYVNAYASILTNLRFLSFAMINSFIYGGAFAFASGAAFLIMDRYGYSSEDFSYIYPITAISVAAGSFVSGRTSNAELQSHAIQFALFGFLVTSICWSAIEWLQLGSVALLAATATYFVLLGLCVPLITARAMSACPSQAGGASAILGSMQAISSAIAAAIIGSAGVLTGIHIGVYLIAMSVLANAAYVLHYFTSYRSLRASNTLHP